MSWTWHREETAMQEFRGYSITGPNGLVIIPPEAIDNEADARLIAAAPDLLAALDRIIREEGLPRELVPWAYEAVERATGTETVNQADGQPA